MRETERRWRAMINPWSSAFTRWWCHSTARYILTGYGRGSGQVAQESWPCSDPLEGAGAVIGLLAEAALAESQDRSAHFSVSGPEA